MDGEQAIFSGIAQKMGLGTDDSVRHALLDEVHHTVFAGQSVHHIHIDKDDFAGLLQILYDLTNVGYSAEEGRYDFRLIFFYKRKLIPTGHAQDNGIIFKTSEE